MAKADHLGLSFSGHHLYFAVRSKENEQHHLDRIGQVALSKPVGRALIRGDKEIVASIKSFVGRLKKQYEIPEVTLVTLPHTECWSVVPKITMDQPEERDAALAIMMPGLKPSQVELNWHTLSHPDLRLLSVRNLNIANLYSAVLEGFSRQNLVSDFELGDYWATHTMSKSSYLLIRCLKGVLSVSSYILGKLRGAFFMHFEEYDDLPYWWKYYSRNVSWLEGLHDVIYVFGEESGTVLDELQAYWDPYQTINRLQDVNDFQLNLEEETYGFSLDLSFPAVMAAVVSG